MLRKLFIAVFGAVVLLVFIHSHSLAKQNLTPEEQQYYEEVIIAQQEQINGLKSVIKLQGWNLVECIADNSFMLNKFLVCSAVVEKLQSKSGCKV